MGEEQTTASLFFGQAMNEVFLFCFETDANSCPMYRLGLASCTQVAVGWTESMQPPDHKPTFGVIACPDDVNLCGLGGGVYFLYLHGI